MYVKPEETQTNLLRLKSKFVVASGRIVWGPKEGLPRDTRELLGRQVCRYVPCLECGGFSCVCVLFIILICLREAVLKVKEKIFHVVVTGT